jgi:predicted transposase YdaD
MPQEAVPEVNDLEEAETMLAENVDEWTEKWKMEGLQAGLQQGLQEGIQIGEQKGIQIGEQKGRQEGRQEERSAVAANALREKIPAETVAKLTGLPIYEIEQIAAGLAD